MNKYNRDNIIGMRIKWDNIYRVSEINEENVYLFCETTNTNYGYYKKVVDFLDMLNNGQIGGTIISEPKIEYLWN